MSTRRVSPFFSTISGLATVGVLALGLAVAVPTAASAAPSLIVTSLLDDGSGGTLREAVAAANAAPGPDVIEITATGTIVLDSVLSFTDDLSIVGPGASDLTVTRSGDFLLMQMVASATGLDLSIDGVTFDGAGSGVSTERGLSIGAFTLVRHVSLLNSVFTNFEADIYGAVVLIDGLSGAFTSTNTNYVDNSTTTWTAGALYLIDIVGGVNITDNEFMGNEAFGATALSVTDSGAVAVTGSTFRNNTAEVQGGAMSLIGNASVTITGTRFETNGALTGVGGAGLIQNTVGRVLVENSEFEGNFSQDREGGALFISSAASLDIEGTSFSSNTAIDSSDGRGGAVYVSSAGPVRITSSTFTENIGLYGGAVFFVNSNGTVVVADSTFTENEASNGGAFYLGSVYTEFSLDANTFTRNRANGGGGAMGGAIWAPYVGDTLRVTGSTFIDNFAEPGSLKGGSSVGVTTINASGLVVIANSTLSESNAFSAEAIVVSNQIAAGGGLTIANSTILANGGLRIVAGGSSSLVANSIVDGNVLGGTARAFAVDTPGQILVRSSVVAQAFDSGHVVDAGGNQFGTDAELGALQDNGGPTLTMEPLAGSPAINAGELSYSFGAANDQRGAPYLRVFGSRVDAGAVEVQVLALAATGLNLNPAVPLGAAIIVLLGGLVLLVRRGSPAL